MIIYPKRSIRKLNSDKSINKIPLISISFTEALYALNSTNSFVFFKLTQSYFPSAGQTLVEKLFAHMSPSGSELRKRECSDSLARILTLTATSALNRIYIEVFCGRTSLDRQGVKCSVSVKNKCFWRSLTYH